MDNIEWVKGTAIWNSFAEELYKAQAYEEQHKNELDINCTDQFGTAQFVPVDEKTGKKFHIL